LQEIFVLGRAISAQNFVEPFQTTKMMKPMREHKTANQTARFWQIDRDNIVRLELSAEVCGIVQPRFEK
jgi:hypothetical protein